MPSSSTSPAALIGRPLAYERVEGVWGDREVPPHKTRRRGFDVGETWFPPRERAEGERRSRCLLVEPQHGSHRRIEVARVRPAGRDALEQLGTDRALVEAMPA